MRCHPGPSLAGASVASRWCSQALANPVAVDRAPSSPAPPPSPRGQARRRSAARRSAPAGRRTLRGGEHPVEGGERVAPRAAPATAVVERVHRQEGAAALLAPRRPAWSTSTRRITRAATAKKCGRSLPVHAAGRPGADTPRGPATVAPSGGPALAPELPRRDAAQLAVDERQQLIERCGIAGGVRVQQYGDLRTGWPGLWPSVTAAFYCRSSAARVSRLAVRGQLTVRGKSRGNRC